MAQKTGISQVEKLIKRKKRIYVILMFDSINFSFIQYYFSFRKEENFLLNCVKNLYDKASLIARLLN